VLAGALLSAGCGKLQPPAPAESPPVAVPSEPPPTETPAAQATPPTPDQTIAAFQSLLAPQRDDDRLRALADTPGIAERLTELDLRDSAVTDLGAEVLPRFTAVTRLDLSGARVTGAALVHAARMPALASLAMDRVQVGNESLAPLAEATGLRALSLVTATIGEPAFEHLARIEGLQSLDVSRNDLILGHSFTALVKQGRFAELANFAADETQFGVAGFQQLGRLQHLETLRAANCGATDPGLLGLQNCAGLRVLWLSGNSVTAAGLKHLVRMKSLEELRLDGCVTITDPALVHLRAHKQLQRLVLNGVTCTPAAVQEMKDKFLQQTQISFGGQEL
jgi:hypothetical protein